MVKRPTAPTTDSTTPSEFPQIPPRDLYATSDIRFVMRDIGELTAKIDRLIDDTKENSAKISDLSKKMVRYEVAFYVGVALIGGFLWLSWYFFGDLIKTTVSSSVRASLIESQKPPQTSTNEQIKTQTTK
jgi:hypothetical protein